MNSRIHVEDRDFALEFGLLPPNAAQGSVAKQFQKLADRAGIPEKQSQAILAALVSKSDAVEQLVQASFLKERIQRSYLQGYRAKLKKLTQGS